MLTTIALLLAIGTAYAESVTATGTIESINAKAGSITVLRKTSKGEKSGTFNISPKAEVLVNGEVADLGSLTEGQSVTVTYDTAAKLVVKIEATAQGYELLPLEEINGPGMDLALWVSADGLEAFWCANTKEDSGDASKLQIYSARRTSPDSFFEDKKRLFPGHGPVLSADGLQMIYASPVGETFNLSTRKTKADEFGRGRPIPGMSFPGLAPAPRWLTEDGLTLYLDMNNAADGRHHTWVTTRSEKKANWKKPTLLQVDFEGMPRNARFTQVSSTADNLQLYCAADFSQPGERRDVRVGILSRQEPHGPFTQWLEIPITAPSVKQPLCLRPLYVPQTGELFLNSHEFGPNAVEQGSWEYMDFWVIKEFRPPGR